MKVNNRKPWIDALRALAIILVVYGHLAKGLNDFFLFTSPIKMPLFFAISGYLFNIRNGDTVSFIKNWAKKLIIPWFCLSLIPIIPQWLLGYENLLLVIYELISGKRLWFMPCFVISELLFFFVQKYAKTEKYVIISSIILSLIGFIFSYYGILRFAMISNAFIVQIYFLIGFIFRMNEKAIISLRNRYIIILPVSYILFCLFSYYYYPNESLDVHLNRYYNIPLCLLLIFVGCMTLFIAFSKNSFSNKILSYIGQNTLVIYIWHGYAIISVTTLFDLFNISFSSKWLSSFLFTIVVLFLSCFFAWLVNKFFPVIVGKKS